MAFKLAFSTLGCPDWTWQEIYSMAYDLGYDGIEIRGLGDHLMATKAKPFLQEEVDATLSNLKKLNLEIACFSLDAVLSTDEGRKAAPKEIAAYVDIAHKVGVKYIRVLADAHPAPQGDINDEKVAQTLQKLALIAQKKKKTLLVETNGVYANTLRLKMLLDQVAHPCVAALWDVHHPFRYFNESPDTTWNNIGQYIRHIHVKDSSLGLNGDIVYRLPGEGDVPLYALFALLCQQGYDGYISLEWVKRWSTEIEDPAIVFPHFVSFVRMWQKLYKESRLDEKSKPTIAQKMKDNAQADVSADTSVPIISRDQGERLFEKDILVDLTFSELLDRVAKRFSDQYAFLYITCNYTRTYEDFLHDVDQVARMLIFMGIKKGAHVAIWATNVPQWFLTFWATVKIGAVLVTVNTSYKIHEAEYLLRQSDTHTLVMIDGYKDADYIKIIHQICPELMSCEPGKLKSERLPKLKNVITIDSRQSGCYFWDEALLLSINTPERILKRMAKKTKPHDVCNMQYTSGTTGFPKGVMLTHHNVINNGKCIGDCMDFSTADRLLIQVPMFHCFGMVLAMIAAVTHGTTMVPIEYFQPARSLEAINMRKITAMHGVPTMFIALLEHENFDQTDFSYMRTGIMAGSPCPVPVMKAVLEKMNMTDITIVFGQTESSPGCTQSRVGDSIDVRVSTVGRALPGVECKIVDPDTNEDLLDNVPGEFVARGYNIMKGYYNMPEATKAAIDKDGWLHTGDLAIRTPEGNYKITGRIKDMIIRGGENVYPKEIEEFLYTHQSVRDVQVIGVPDKVYGEEIMAYIILKDGEQVTENELKEYVRSHMAKHKTPKYISFVNYFPMNAAGKVLKYKMREAAIKDLGLEAEANTDTA